MILALCFVAGLLVGILGALLIVRLMQVARFPSVEIWQRAMVKTRGERAAVVIAARVQARLDQLYAGRPRYGDRWLRRHLEQNILPGLALYQVLRDVNGGDKDATLKEVDALFAETDFHRLKLDAVLMPHIPDAFNVLRNLGPALTSAYPPSGWDMEVVANDDQTYGIDIHDCFYLNTLRSYGAMELTPLFCTFDDRQMASLPPTVIWERTKTLGRGNEVCAFRWHRAALPPKTS